MKKKSTSANHSSKPSPPLVGPDGRPIETKNPEGSASPPPPQPEPQPKSPPEQPQHNPAPATAEKDRVAELEEQIMRMRADFENFRKRLQKEKEDSVRYANETLLQELLPILDNFSLGLQAAETATDAKAIAQGMSMVHTQLLRFLENVGIKPIDAEGSAFDPHFHEAVAQEHHETVPEGHVIAQRRRGFVYHERLLRPAAVIVSQGPAPKETDENPASQNPA